MKKKLTITLCALVASLTVVPAHAGYADRLAECLSAALAKLTDKLDNVCPTAPQPIQCMAVAATAYDLAAAKCLVSSI